MKTALQQAQELVQLRDNTASSIINAVRNTTTKSPAEVEKMIQHSVKSLVDQTLEAATYQAGTYSTTTHSFSVLQLLTQLVSGKSPECKD